MQCAWVMWLLIGSSCTPLFQIILPNNAMNVTITDLVEDCKKFSDLSYVKNHYEELPGYVQQIAKEAEGDAVLAAGVGIFRYLALLVESRGESSIRDWLIPLLGYTDHKYTDLYSSFYDVSRTQLLWFHSTDKLHCPIEKRIEIILNIYFRWYISSIELMRKMLAFALHCKCYELEKQSQYSLDRLLYHGSDPTKGLKHFDNSGTCEAVTFFYETSARHALAHGNVVIALPHLIAVRESVTAENDMNTKYRKRTASFKQEVFYIGTGTSDAEAQKVVDYFQKYADPCFQSCRVFFAIYSMIHSKNKDLLVQYWPKDCEDPVLSALNKVISEDPVGLKYW